MDDVSYSLRAEDGKWKVGGTLHMCTMRAHVQAEEWRGTQGGFPKAGALSPVLGEGDHGSMASSLPYPFQQGCSSIHSSAIKHPFLFPVGLHATGWQPQLHSLSGEGLASEKCTILGTSKISHP